MPTLISVYFNCFLRTNFSQAIGLPLITALLFAATPLSSYATTKNVFMSPSTANALEVFHTALGGQVKLFADGMQKYDYNEILQSPAYRTLAIGQSLIDDFIITFKDSGQKFLYVVTITRTQNTDKPTVQGRKLLIIKETPIGGIIYREREGKLGYYAGDILKSPIYGELAPGKKIFETFCINPQLCNLLVEITKPTVAEEKPLIKVIHPHH
jgi:VCBS repeat-containing protein